VRCWEGDDGGVAQRIDLDTTVGAEHPPQDRAVLGERLRLGGHAELVQQLRRALYVGGEEGTVPGGSRRTAS
jgi:hypothetical protein